jgi:hypothetical protein
VAAATEEEALSLRYPVPKHGSPDGDHRRANIGGHLGDGEPDRRPVDPNLDRRERAQCTQEDHTARYDRDRAKDRPPPPGSRRTRRL